MENEIEELKCCDCCGQMKPNVTFSTSYATGDTYACEDCRGH